MPYAHKLGGACNHLAELFQGGCAAMLQVMRIEAETQHAAAFRKGAQDVVGLVAHNGVPGMRIGMGDGNRAR